MAFAPQDPPDEAGRDIPPASAIRGQLELLERSRTFAGSDRLVELLRFVVEETLAGRAGALKEAVIGNAVYGREPAYDPRIDSTVRVEARRLRRKLAAYYADEGRHDPVHAAMPTGGYAVTFRWAAAPPAAADSPMFRKGAGAALAVLPFRALSREGLDEDFADGLTDELIFVLGQAPGLHVASRSSVFPYKDKAPPAGALAAELGVDAVMQGTVRRAGSLLRVTVEVSDPRGFVVWADRFDAPDDALMQLQEKIAATMLSRMRLDSSRMRADEIGPGPVALDALARVIRARQLLDRQTPADLGQAMQIFERVAVSVPDYARGHAGIADCACDLYRLGVLPHDAASAPARRAAQRALDVDPLSVDAHAALGTIAAWLDVDRVAAEAAFEKALSLGESARAARIYGVFLTILERHEDAAKLFRAARAIEPFSSQQDVAEAISHYQSRQFPLAIRASRERSGRTPGEARCYEAFADVFAGGGELARTLASEIGDDVASLPDLVFAGAEIEALLGDRTRAVQLIGVAGGVASHFARATLAAALGEDEKALAALAASIERRELSRFWIRTDARFDRLRGSAAFERLLQQVGPAATG